MSKLLICTDLDRTLLPNGDQAESTTARVRFRQLVQHKQVTLAYVTGRHQQLVEQAMVEYQLPQPDYVIADVGSSIYEVKQMWRLQHSWEQKISRDWQGHSAEDLQHFFQPVKNLQLQEQSKQNTHKLSYYVALEDDHQQIISSMQQILQQQSIQANLIWSVDEQENVGLLDVLPASAGKRQAIEFLMQQFEFDYSNTIFAGDSGNDICVLSSPIHSVLVANASDEVRMAAIKQAQQNNQADALYLAEGDYLEMNGNYSAGILEGVAYYFPQAEQWFRGTA